MNKMIMKNYKKLIGLCILSAGTSLFAQEALKSIEEDYYDFLSLSGLTEAPTLGYRTLSDSVWSVKDDSVHPWQENNLGRKKTLFTSSADDNFFTAGINKSVSYKIYGPEWYNSYNTKTPYGQNDGALWQGRGYNTSLTGGARFEAYGFEITLKPQLYFSQNLAFDYLPGVYGDTHSYFSADGGGIDLVQRYGDSSFFGYDLGDSEIRWNWHTFTIGFGNQNPWVGPAILNPMLGSNNAPSYTKLDFGLRKTDIIIPGINLNLGQIETRMWLGKLSESEYFDNNPDNDSNFISAFYFAYSPSILPELSLGATKICVTRWRSDVIKYLNPFYSENDLNGYGEDQKASLFVQALFTPVALRLYFEYGIDDYSTNLLANPFHTGVYTLGFEKEISLGKKAENKNIKSSLSFECNFFEMSQDFQMEWPYTGYYSHGEIRQSYTNKGQILGAGSGYFGNSQYINYTVYYPKGKTSLYVHRNCPDTNYIYKKSVYVGPAETNQFYDSYTTYLSFGLNSLYFITDSLSVSAGLDLMRVENYMYDKANDFFNLQASASVKYNF